MHVTESELKKLVRDAVMPGTLNLAYQDLSDMDLRWLNHTGANFNNADLRRVNLSGCPLSGSYVHLDPMLSLKASFENANLCNADLTKALLIGAYFKHADLQGTN